MQDFPSFFVDEAAIMNKGLSSQSNNSEKTRDSSKTPSNMKRSTASTSEAVEINIEVA